MTSIGCDCIILVIMNGYVHLGSEGGQYVGHERAAKLVPTWVLCLVLSCLLTLYTAVMSFEILFPFGLWVSEPDWLLNHSQLV